MIINHDYEANFFQLFYDAGHANSTYETNFCQEDSLGFKTYQRIFDRYLLQYLEHEEKEKLVRGGSLFNIWRVLHTNDILQY